MSIEWHWQGAEAKVGTGTFFGRTVIFKERVKKEYRHPQLDQKLTSRRCLQEVRCMIKARRNGIRTPAIYSVDPVSGLFVMEQIHGTTLKQAIINLEHSNQLVKAEQLARLVGNMVANLHNLDIIHGDLTTSNILIDSKSDDTPVLIDFGLSYGSNLIEDKAVDLYVLERAISSTHPACHEALFKSAMEGYKEAIKNPKPILGKLADVQLRGRKREMVPDVLPEISIPPEISPDAVQTVLIDSSNKDEVKMRDQIKGADVICVVYAIDDSHTFQRLGSYWLPLIQSNNSSVPIVLVGNKIDVRGPDVTNEDLEDQILPLMSEYKEIETCVECSAMTLINVAEAFYFAQKAVLHPTGPLYDSREHVMKEACVRALQRMFRLSDKNRDGFLDDEEINAFQVKCFKTPLQMEELESIKEILKESEPSAVTPQGITMEGFIFLHKLFIQRGRLETTWSALRAFGYDDNLELKPEILKPAAASKVPKDSIVTIGPKGYQFFTELFKSFDLDCDGCLSWEQLDLLFATSPENPWLPLGFPENTLTDERGAITLEGFLAQWSMTTLLNWRVTLEYLGWLGFDDRNGMDALKIVPSGKKGRSQRDTFLCWVLGAVGSGKTALCRNFIRRPFDASYRPTLTPYHVVNGQVDGQQAGEKYLVLEEISCHGGLDQEIMADKALLAMADVICYVYDASDLNSFSHIIKLRKEHPELAKIPGLIVATKTDKEPVEQKVDGNLVNPAEYCQQEGLLPGPIPASAKEDQTEEVWPAILQAALCPTPPSRKANSKTSSCNWMTWGLASTLVAVGAASAFAAYRWHKNKQP